MDPDVCSQEPALLQRLNRSPGLPCEADGTSGCSSSCLPTRHSSSATSATWGREMTKMADAASLDSLSYLLEAETLMSLRHRLARKNHMTQYKRVSRLPALRGPPRAPGLS